MTERFDVIVVGVGAMGSAACQQLAVRGLRVLGLEQFDIPHARGSSHGFTRAIRLAYHEHPDYVPLLRRAYELWHALEELSGQQLLTITGGLYLGSSRSQQLRDTVTAAEEHRVPYETLDRQALAERFPQFQVPEDFWAVLESQAGFLRPELAVAAQVMTALGHGAVIHGHEPVLQWQADPACVRVVTQRGVYEAERVVFCGGAWTGRLLADLKLPLRVSRQPMAWFWPQRPELFGLDRLPIWALAHDDGSSHYGFPTLPDNPGFKIARHWPGETADPDALDRNGSAADEADCRDFLQRYLPLADGPLMGLRICMYTNSPDGHFIVDRHPQFERVVLAGGFSGHGFKFAPVIGEILADLAVDGATRLPAGFLSLTRLSPGTCDS